MNKKRWHLWLGFGFLYVVGLSFNLTRLPVFADEAIYIRWAQIMVHDHTKFFVPLYDGKTPLFMWLLIPFLNLTPLDPLWAARFLSILAGLGTTIFLIKITQLLGGLKRAAVISGGLSLILPFTFFYARMGLIDELLTLFLAAGFYFLLRWRTTHFRPLWVLFAGVCWGLALITKTSAFYFALIPFGVFGFTLTEKKRWQWRPLLWLCMAEIVGLMFLAFMKISPWFPFLFQRSSDFAYPVSQIIREPGHIIWVNLLRIFKWLFIYGTPGIFLLIWGIYKRQRPVLLLTLCLGLFLLPFVITGKLLSSRYFLPAVIFLIPGMSLLLSEWWKNKLIFTILAAMILFFSLRFDVPLVFNPGQTPFAHEDVVQYLTEWSSGYGIPETRDLIADRAKDHRVIVGTEGYFGTLPDGLLMYFDRSPLIKNMEIFGVGQPLGGVPPQLQAKTSEGDVYLLVNQHRWLLTDYPSNIELVGRFPRPRSGPPLLLFRIYPL